MGNYVVGITSSNTEEDTSGTGYDGTFIMRTGVLDELEDEFSFDMPAALTVGSSYVGVVRNKDGFRVVGLWSSSNTKVATVDSNGKVTAKAPGKATIEIVAPELTTITDLEETWSRAITVVPKQTFKDVPPSNRFFDEIEWMAAKNISTGWPDRTYRPLQSVKRDAMAAFLYRAAGKPSFSAPLRPSFKDVKRSNQFSKEIEWMKRTGISTGWKDGTFEPLSSVKRDAMAAFLMRAEKYLR